MRQEGITMLPSHQLSMSGEKGISSCVLEISEITFFASRQRNHLRMINREMQNNHSTMLCDLPAKYSSLRSKMTSPIQIFHIYQDIVSAINNTKMKKTLELAIQMPRQIMRCKWISMQHTHQSSTKKDFPISSSATGCSSRRN